MKQNNTNDTIPEILNSLNSVVLTTAGKVWMSGFEDASIRAGDTALCRKLSNVSDPFRYLFAVAKKHSDENAKKIDWAKRMRLAQQYGVVETMPMVEKIKSQTEHKTNSKAGNSSNQKTSSDNTQKKTHTAPNETLIAEYMEKFRSLGQYIPRFTVSREAESRGGEHFKACLIARDRIDAEKNSHNTVLENLEKELEKWDSPLVHKRLQAIKGLDSEKELLALRERSIYVLKMKIEEEKSKSKVESPSKETNDDGWEWDIGDDAVVEMF